MSSALACSCKTLALAKTREHFVHLPTELLLASLDEPTRIVEQRQIGSRHCLSAQGDVSVFGSQESWHVLGGRSLANEIPVGVTSQPREVAHPPLELLSHRCIKHSLGEDMVAVPSEAGIDTCLSR